MMKRMKRLFKKLSSRRGESIAEALIGLLIAALALTLLAGMIGASSHMVLNSKKNMADYVDGQNALNARTGGTSGSVNLDVVNPIPNVLVDGGADGAIPVEQYQIHVGKETVVAYAVKGGTTP